LLALPNTRVDYFLHARSILYQRDFFETVTPVNFYTIATPHLGVPRLPTFISTILSTLAPRLSRTGEQFFCVDKWGTTERPLLQVMADPGVFIRTFGNHLSQPPPERIFYRALALFTHITIYANASVVFTPPCEHPLITSNTV